MDYWFLLATQRQMELLREAEHHRLVRQAQAARASRRERQGHVPTHRRAAMWLAGRLIAAGQSLETRYGKASFRELDVALEKPCC
jgi:hypothetical protein